MTKSAILVAGGAGYIGSHACKMLHNMGYPVVVLDNLSRGFRKLARWGEFVQADLADKEALDAIFKKYSIGAVMHFAAFAYVGESVSKPDIYYINNVVNTVNLLEAMRNNGVSRLVFSSTCASYGNPVYIPINEEHPQNPINPYGRSKWMVEQIIKDYHHAYNLQYTILRYFNAAGSDPDQETGECHDPEPHVIPLALKAADGQIPHLTVFGTDYDTPDGTCIRDYIHVNDISQAHILAVKWMEQGANSGIFNLGNGNGFSVKQIAETVEKVTGKKVPVVYGDRRPGDPPNLIADASKARITLGWNPQHPDLEEIIRHAWNWLKK